VDAFHTVLRLKPDHVLGHYNLGLCLKQQGKLAEAAEAYRTALRYRADYAPARQALEALTATPSR
jgi:cytochrome c-type biogenesis protein CcmH/NrfG